MLVGQTIAAERWGLDTGGIDRVNEWRGIARTDIKRDEFERRGREGGRGGACGGRRARYIPVHGGKVRGERERWGDREKRTKLRSEGGRYCYLRFIVITDGTTSLASNPERSYNHPPPPTSISSPLAPLLLRLLYPPHPRLSNPPRSFPESRACPRVAPPAAV